MLVPCQRQGSPLVTNRLVSSFVISCVGREQGGLFILSEIELFGRLSRTTTSRRAPAF